MIRKILLPILLLIFITSCDYLSYKKPIITNIPKADTVDYSRVDDYPVFPECDSIPSQDKQRICFQMEMSKYIHLSLNQLDINVKSELNDTIIVKIMVDNNGKTRLSSIQKSNQITQYLPKLDSIVKVGLEALPILQPAIKRGIPVTAEFSLPIIIKTN